MRLKKVEKITQVLYAHNFPTHISQRSLWRNRLTHFPWRMPGTKEKQRKSMIRARRQRRWQRLRLVCYFSNGSESNRNCK